MEKQIIKFVIDKELDIANHFNALNAYKRNKERGFTQNTNENIEKLLNLASDDERKIEIKKTIEKYYLKEEKLLSLADDINKEWIKIEKDFIKKLEDVHGFSFPYDSVKGVLSTASRFGYKPHEGWFATDMTRNKFFAMDVATHELMHFMFHAYYDKICEEKGLSKDQMWDIKESFTVLLNSEFSEFRMFPDYGYSPHVKLRELIKISWQKNKNFKLVLNDAINFTKNN